MFVSSALITLYSSVKFFTDLRQHLKVGGWVSEVCGRNCGGVHLMGVDEGCETGPG
jgi:hypothetical protein